MIKPASQVKEEIMNTVSHAASCRSGYIVCGTSNHADGSPRVIVEWNDGTQSSVRETELQELLLCKDCGEDCSDPSNTTWQQWQCDCCGSWNDKGAK